MRISKRIICDFILNIIASALPIGILQLVVLPIISKSVDNEFYGYILTITATISIIVMALGNILNNVRLLMNKEYEKNGVIGDFNFILLIMGIINIIVLIIFMFAYNQYNNILSIILTVVYSLLYMVQLYLSVDYRLKLNFKRVVISSILMTIGYLIGLVVFNLTKTWQYIYILGIGLSLIYQLFTTRLLSEPFCITKLFNMTLKKTLILIATSVLINAMVYLDRIILYPILGGENVTIYYVASMFGKIISMIITPISAVLLSYYTKKSKLELKTFWVINIIVLVLSFIAYIAGVFVSKIIIGFMYPKVIDEAIKYMNIANLAAIINVAATIVQPALLNFCKTKWQMIIQICHIMCYIVGIILFVEKYKLMGFCYVALVSNGVRLLLMFIIGTLSLSKNKSIGDQNFGEIKKAN